MSAVRAPRVAHDAPRPRPGVRLLELGGEAVLADPAGGLHHLNATGAVVWRCLDGRATLAEIAADVAAVTGTPLPEVLADLTRLADQLDAAGLLEPVGGEARPVGPAPAGRSGRRTLDEPGSCIPCGSRLAGMPWTGLVTLGVGDLAVGVRTHPDAATDLVTATFAPLVLGDEAARDNFSVRLAPGSAGPAAAGGDPAGPVRAAGPRRLHLCYRADRLIGRARTPGPLLRTLAAHLASLAPPPGLCPLDAAAVLDRDGRAVLLAPAPALDVAFDRALRAVGLRLGDGPPLWDPDAGEVRIGAPGLPCRLEVPPDGIWDRARPVGIVTDPGPDGAAPPPAAALVRLAAGRVPAGAPEALAALVAATAAVTVDPALPAPVRAERLASLLADSAPA